MLSDKQTRVRFPVLCAFLLFLALAPARAAEGDFTIDSEGVLTKYNGSGGDVTIPSGVSEIGDFAFYGCTGLERVTISGGVAKIGTSAFDGCTGLESVTIENGVSEIGDFAFWRCESLPAVTIPGSVAKIGSAAFSSCVDPAEDLAEDLTKGLTEIEVSPENQTYSSVKGVLFSKDKKTLLCYPAGKRETTYAIPGTVASIDNLAFYGCIKLENLTIETGVAEIGDSAFYGCKRLKSVTVPESVTRVGRSAFSGCPKLESLTIETGVAEICESAFSACTSLKSVTIPGSVNLIDGYTFFGCTGLESATIQTGVAKIGESAFSGCINLESLTIENGVTEIGESAFFGCESLKRVTIPGSAVSIDSFAFSGCTGLESVTLETGVAEIGSFAFSGCAGLNRVTIPRSVSSIDSRAFSRCSTLNGMDVSPENQTYSSVEGTLFSKDKKTLFYYPTGKQEKTYAVPENVTEIGEFAFWYCDVLDSVTIPESVAEICDFAFSECANLTRVCYSGSQEEWNAISIGLSNEALENATLEIKLKAALDSGGASVSLREDVGAVLAGGSAIYAASYSETGKMTAILLGTPSSDGTKITFENGTVNTGDTLFLLGEHQVPLCPKIIIREP